MQKQADIDKMQALTGDDDIMALNTERRVITTQAVKEKQGKKALKTGNLLRPISFDTYIGQSKVKEQVSVSVKSAMIRKKPAPHMLFYGPPGLGKTTLAHIVAEEENVPLKEIAGPSIEKPGDIAAILMSLKQNEVLFIDEIHRMPSMCEEVLYSAMEDNYINITVGAGEQQKIVHLPLPAFTLIGATTRAGMVSAPLRDRFALKCRMEYYDTEELSEIIKNSAVKMDIRITDSEALMIAEASRGTPRIANSLLERVRDYATVKTQGNITEQTVKDALEFAGIDKDGLSEMDRMMIKILKDQDKPVGLQTLADMLGEDAKTIEDVYEPFLLKNGYIEKTPRGRTIGSAVRSA